MAATAMQTAQPNGAAPHPLTKNAKRRQKKKQQQQQQQQNGAPASAASASDAPATPSASTSTSTSDPTASTSTSARTSRPSLIDDSVLELDPESDAYKAFSHVFSRFQQPADGGDGAGDGADGFAGPQKGEVIYSDEEVASDSEASDGEGNSRPKLSQRKQRKLQRLTVAELKQLVRKPEVVEWTDVTANDPRLLVQLKSQRNTVPVPPHWSQKRDYLQNKRGIEKPPYQLPHYIADTGIATMKDALKEKEAEQTLKQKTRERVQPKMGKMDIDYQKLHDAFFKFQSKPDLSPYGETYYEGKENECKFKDRRPGDLSDELKEALSIPPLAPPPWLIAMQRYGPPPSYPHLKVPGLNAPIPEGAQWGFHPGGWGRPPVDEYGRPLYGDVLGAGNEADGNEYADPVQKEPWGELEPEETDDEEEEDEDEDEGGDDEGEEGEEGQQTGDADRAGGLETPSGTASVASTFRGMETPSTFELRKDSRNGSDSTVPSSSAAAASAGPDAPPRALYQVLPERSTSITGFMGSERIYDLGPALGTEERGTKRKAGGAASGADQIELAVDPAELEGLTPEEVQAKLSRLQREEEQRRSSSRFASVEGKDREGVAQVREELSRQRHQKAQRRDEREREEKKERYQF
ncbi:uncharacterized protein PFL1_05213 [Pseudozyma flocculosa PF-1]|uniref:Related to Splicing factor 3b, subunit 2 n=2 Tax=Pseudozyma flocculosa TaxID=84751 RepID=A0A5C3F8I1_9BASI|nr:uncharacterized protein PFL1_05213 [Pseudozyma flocculosa PF-1]EPQ27290.1 hypothetical protein PFL1_05213 [Pseudozyma flocculosa PF-1]SPO39661.1 related to Splicing factor 3b, subunit 2 [Pseudozyma flocculosa]